MDRINALGNDYERYKLFTKELLSETDDEELQQIVKQAAQELNSPISLVSLVIDQIQYFKAHTGLPEILQSSRGTHRDASFCQFVVRDGDIFEVNDAPNDPRIPQHVVKEFNINSYLGVPIKFNDLIVGSLCVLDTKKRKFSEEERQMLDKLSKKVDERLETITKNRKQLKLDLTYRTLGPAFKEISNTIRPIQQLVNLGHSHIATIRSFLNIARQFTSIQQQNSETIRMSLEAAIDANDMIEDRILNIEMNVLNSIDSLNALNNLISDFSGSSLSEILVSAQDLTRNATKAVGGFPMPYLDDDPILYVKADFAIALISNCLLFICAELNEIESKKGIELIVEEKNDFVDLKFSSKALNKETAIRLYSQLNLLVGDNQPQISLTQKDTGIVISFKKQIKNQQ